MVSDSIIDAPIPSAPNSKDFSKKKRANSATLKQCNIDARREQQCLSQVYLPIYKVMATDWAQINGDVLEEIVKRINLYENFVTFSCVCTPWSLAATKENFNHSFRSNQVPWLMLSPEEGNTDHLRSFYSLERGKSKQIVLEEASDHKCFSSRGWLLTIDKKLNISLLDPFSRFHIELPHMNTFSDWEDDDEPLLACAMFINKCFLHGIPSKSDYTLMVIHGGLGKLAFFRPGLKSWITVPLWDSHYSDIIYYNEQFYAIDVAGRIVVVDIKSDNTHAAHQVANMPRTHLNHGLDKVYLVEIDRILLVIIRNRNEEVTFSFKVLQVELSTNTWTEVHSLGNKTLFLGDNSSLAIEALEFSGCKSNCIYFTEDYADEYYRTEKGGGKDMGIYHLEDGRIEPHFSGDSCHCFTPPLWVEKSF